MMQAGKPSKTAWAAAAHRAAHQILEQGRIFSDPLALRILGEDANTIRRWAEEEPSRRRMRIFIAARTRFAEDALAVEIERGVRQVIVLGAGLDTFAYRHQFGDRIRVFEVDNPDTQAWKRERLAAEAIPVPNSLTHVSVNFESETLAGRLAAGGFDRAQPAFFTWLGVVPYLTGEAIWSTLGFIAGLPNGAHVVFDYSDPPASLSLDMREFHDRRAAEVAAIGEAWVSYFDRDALREKLMAIGFRSVRDAGPREIAALYFPVFASSLPEKGGHILHAATH